MVNKVEQEIRNGGVWELVTFEVPASIPEERVQASAEKYMSIAGDCFVKHGFKIHKITRPKRSKLLQAFTPSDKAKYFFQAFVSRRPQEIHMDIPDYAVHGMQDAGMILTE